MTGRAAMPLMAAIIILVCMAAWVYGIRSPITPWIEPEPAADLPIPKPNPMRGSV